MQARKITIISTRDQKQSVIMSAAETLGELKVDLDEAGIDYSGLSFFERVAKVELKEDTAILPHDVPYQGRVTNELVFLLTNTETKIKSGLPMSRLEAYTYIREYNLQEECIATYGKNFTQCSTEDLLSLIEGYKGRVEQKMTVESVYQMVMHLLTTLTYNGYLTQEEYNNISSSCDVAQIVKEEILSYTKEGTSSYSNDELKALCEGVV